jgi:hypothetical protein
VPKDCFATTVRFACTTVSTSALSTRAGVTQACATAVSEQIIYGRVYRTVAELRAAVDAFVDLDNEQWLPEKNGFLTPAAMREAWYARKVAA